MIRQDYIATLRNVVISIKEGGRYTKAQYIEHLIKIADTTARPERNMEEDPTATILLIMSLDG